MAKQQKQIIIIGVLVVVLLIACVNVFLIAKKRVGKSSSVSSVSMIKSQIETAQPQEAEQSAYPTESSLEWLRCPFSGKFYTGHKSESLDLKLEGILWDKEKPQAIINNEVVSAGDSVSGYIVLEIGQYNVVLTDGISVFELKLESLVK